MTTAVDQRPRFYLESNMDQPELIDVTNGHVVAFSRRCPGKLEPNDDSGLFIRLTEDRFVIAVADGVGGSPLGYKASSIAMQCLAETLAACQQTPDLRPAILDGIENANEEILDLGAGAATTVSVVEVDRRVARGYQVGDSMAVILGQRGLVKWKSTCHSPVGYAIESGMIDEDDAMHHDQRHVVSNLVGSREMHIEIGPAIRLANRDTIVVGSDGLFDNLHSNEVIQRSRMGRPLDRITALVALATERMNHHDDTLPGKPDDLTILMLTP